MAIQYSILSKDQIREKIGLDGSFKINGRQILQVQEKLRDELEKDTLTYLDTYNHLLYEISEVFAKNGKNIANFINTAEPEYRINIREIVKAYNELDVTFICDRDHGNINVGVRTIQLLFL